MAHGYYTVRVNDAPADIYKPGHFPRKFGTKTGAIDAATAAVVAGASFARVECPNGEELDYRPTEAIKRINEESKKEECPPHQLIIKVNLRGKTTQEQHKEACALAYGFLRNVMHKDDQGMQAIIDMNCISPTYGEGHVVVPSMYDGWHAFDAAVTCDIRKKESHG